MVAVCFIAAVVVSSSLGAISPASADDMRAAEGDVLLTDFTPETRDDAGRTASRDLKSPRDTSAGPAAVGPTDKKAGPGCSVQCITSGVAVARNAGAELRVQTDTPARIQILVWNDDYARFFDSGNGAYVTEFRGHFDDLEAGTTYQAFAQAVDAQGYKSEATGQFDTLRRAVEISFSGAVVVDNAFAESQFGKYVWAEGEWLEDYEAHGFSLHQGVLFLGENTIELPEVDRHLDLAVQLIEANQDVDGLVEGHSGTPSEPVVAGDEYYSWSYAFLEDDDLDDRPAGATSWTEHTLQGTLIPAGQAYGLPPGFGQALSFYVNATLHVTYY
jgi:hypothetical protein